MTRKLIAASVAVCAMAAFVVAQDTRPLSPTGTAAAQVLGKYVKPEGRGAPALGGERYEGGKWIEINYGRPLKRGRDLWGSYGYTPDKDVVRAPMKLETLPHSTEELTWEFIDMSDAGGAMAIRWDKVMASVPFNVGT